MSLKAQHIIALLGINLLYACVGIFSKSAAAHPFMSLSYMLWFAGAILVMAVYAVCWQQVLKRIELSAAYMFKGTALIFAMLLAWLLFDENITQNNILGASIIIIGIALFAKE